MQSKNKNVRFQFSERYWSYLLTKRHLRGTSRPQIFPLLRSDSNSVPGDKEAEKQFANTITGKYGTGNGRGTHIRITKKGIEKRNQGIAACLSGEAHSGGNHSDMDLLTDNMRIRRLTPVEAERLQGFPDGWTETGIDIKGNCVAISNTQRYRCLGNAVTTNVITAISKKLLTPSIGIVRI